MGYSLGFWLEHSKEKSEIKEPKNLIELHINYWSIESKEKFHYLDIGVKLTLNNSDLDSINFFFPFDLQNQDYMDNLGETICSKDELLELIFNEKLKGTSDGKNYKDVYFEGLNKDHLRIYKELDIGNGGDAVVLTPNNDGTSRLKFSKSLLKADKELSNPPLHHYFRFRLRLSSENVKKLSQNYDPQDRLVVSRFEKIEIIDFRINELRDLPGSVCNVLNNNYTLKQIHFFLIRDIHDELKLAHADYKRCRLLEKEVWKEYLIFSKKDLVLPSQMIIYHFSEGKQKEGVFPHIDRFNAFAKFARVKITISSLIVFLVSVVILGALGSFISTLITENRPIYIEKLFKGENYFYLISAIFLLYVFGITIYLLLKNYTPQWPLKKK